MSICSGACCSPWPGAAGRPAGSGEWRAESGQWTAERTPARPTCAAARLPPAINQTRLTFQLNWLESSRAELNWAQWAHLAAELISWLAVRARRPPPAARRPPPTLASGGGRSEAGARRLRLQPPARPHAKQWRPPGSSVFPAVSAPKSKWDAQGPSERFKAIETFCGPLNGPVGLAADKPHWRPARPLRWRRPIAIVLARARRVLAYQSV